MSIYQINGYNAKSTYYVDQSTHDANPNYGGGTLIVGTEADAQSALTALQTKVLAYEAVRFSICSTFVDGNNTTWREIQDTDPDNTICQVFDTMTGTYTQVNTVTEAKALNAQKQQAFLEFLGLDSVKTIDSLPTFAPQPKSSGTQTL